MVQVPVWALGGRKQGRGIAAVAGRGAGGETIDLVASRNGRKIAFEIETGKSDAAANVQKCRDAGFERIVLVATSSRVRDALLAELTSRSNVRVMTGPEAVREISKP